MLTMDEPPLPPLDPHLQAWIDAVMRTISPARLRAEVVRFPAPRNRLHAPEAMAQADELLLESFGRAGWEVTRHPFSFQDMPGNLDYGTYDSVIYPRVDGVNVVAVKAGVVSEEVVVVDAHHDTVRDSPGADDNTASVVAVLELARILAPCRFRRTIMLAATDMEELSFFGAKAFLAELLPRRHVVGAIVLETMAYGSSAPHSQAVPPGIGQLYPAQVQRLARRGYTGDFTAVLYSGPAVALAASFGAGLSHLAGEEAPMLLRDPNDLPGIGTILGHMIPAVRDFSRSNHVVFREAAIPVLQITDTANFRNPHYHRPSDTPETLDYDRLAAVIGATAVALAEAAELQES